MATNNLFLESGKLYSKRDLYKILKVPEGHQRGNWDTGYHYYQGNSFIFANIEIAGRTGHNYSNHWSEEGLVWFGRNSSHIEQESIRRLIYSENKVYIFTRTNARDLFTFNGEATVIRFTSSKPICIIWGIISLDKFPEEIGYIDEIKEGALRSILINRYERSSWARKICINYYGSVCQICSFDFEKVYGKVGKDFIHVHHLTPLSVINNEYTVDPIKDLLPVCPNCHSMLHRRKPPYSVLELISLMNHILQAPLVI